MQIGEVPMQDPIALFLTWSTYGTWLPGDERGWTDHHHGWQLPDPVLRLECTARMTEDACLLTHTERSIVEAQIEETCGFRNWKMHAVNCRSNHLHTAVSAPETNPEKVRESLKAWCTRRLKERSQPNRKNWWAEGGSIRRVWNETELESVIRYINDAQDRKHLDDL